MLEARSKFIREGNLLKVLVYDKFTEAVKKLAGQPKVSLIETLLVIGPRVSKDFERFLIIISFLTFFLFPVSAENRNATYIGPGFCQRTSLQLYRNTSSTHCTIFSQSPESFAFLVKWFHCIAQFLSNCRHFKASEQSSAISGFEWRCSLVPEPISGQDFH